MTTPPTISELLSLSQSQFRIYDVGRKVDKLTKEEFLKFEESRLPYPYPTQGHAFLAIAFWQKNNTSPYLWFVKLPLDERGLLNQGARDHFVAIIIEALGSDLTVDPTEKQEELLKSNPYHFTPSQYKLAFLNSTLKVALKQDPSSHYQEFSKYLSEKDNYDQWHHIGVQGIADFAARLSFDNNRQLLTESFEQLPEQVLFPLCAALENVELPVALIEKIIEKADKELQTVRSHELALAADTKLKTALLRSLATTSHHPYVKSYYEDKLLDLPQKLSEETLIAIAGKCWNILSNKNIAMHYLEQLVLHDDDLLFASLFRDLVAIPTLRPILFQCMRDTTRSDRLSKAIGLLFNQSA